MTSDDAQRAGSAGDWLATAIVVLVYFTYMLLVAFAPQVLATTVHPGSAISVGLVSGAAIALFTIALACYYTYRRNRSDRGSR